MTNSLVCASSLPFSLLCLGEPEAPVLLAADGNLQGSILAILIRSRPHEDALLFLQALPLDLQPCLLSHDFSLPEKQSVTCQIAGPQGCVNDEEVVQGNYKDQKEKSWMSELRISSGSPMRHGIENAYFTAHYELSLFLSLHFT